jgi:hypothetical protein
MNKASSLKGNSEIAAAGGGDATLPRPRSGRRARHKDDRRRAFIVVLGSIFALGIIGLIGSQPLMQVMSRPSAEKANAKSAEEHRIGRMVIDTGSSSGCRQGTFDNQTGRMTPASEQCAADVLDKNGVPVPQGTVNRLNSISKSFSNR